MRIDKAFDSISIIRASDVSGIKIFRSLDGQKVYLDFDLINPKNGKVYRRDFVVSIEADIHSNQILTVKEKE